MGKKQDKLIRSFGVPKNNVNGAGLVMTDARQAEIAEAAKTQNGRVGGTAPS